MDSPQNNTELLKCGSSCSHCFVLCIYFTIRLQSIPHVLMSFIKQTKKKKSPTTQSVIFTPFPSSFIMCQTTHTLRNTIFIELRGQKEEVCQVWLPTVNTVINNTALTVNGWQGCSLLSFCCRYVYVELNLIFLLNISQTVLFRFSHLFL